MTVAFHCVCTVIVFIGITRPAQAYLDPGSGSFIFQLILGAVLGALVTLRLTFAKIKRFIANLARPKRDGQKRQ